MEMSIKNGFNNLPKYSLQTFCLYSIVKNLDSFYDAFFGSNPNYKLSLEFIQRFYSSTLLQYLAETSLMETKYLPIVINKYTKELDFRCISKCDLTAILDLLKEFGSVIQRFSMIFIKPFYYYDEILGCLPNVEIIDLQYTNCSDKTIKRIAEHCQNLKSLNLNGCCKISDKGLIYVAEKKLPLESLNLQDTSVTYKGVASILKNIPTLKTLIFINVPRAIFEALGLNDATGDFKKGKVFQLTNLMILNRPLRPEAHLTSTLKACLTLCPFIEDLTVTEIVNETQLHLCSSFQEIKMANLQCSWSSTNRLSANDFLKVRGDKICSLTLLNFSLSVSILVNNCPNLKQLTLEHPSFEIDPDIHYIKKLVHLEKLNFQSTSLHSEENVLSVSAIISAAPNVEELNLRACQFIEKIYDVILNHSTQLKTLGFGNSAVDATFLENVLRVHIGLTKLRLCHCGISTEDFDDLLDFVDSLERNIDVEWSDYNEAINELYSREFDTFYRPTILKL